MIIYKVGGGAILLLSTLIFYRQSIKFEKAKLSQLDGFIMLVCHIKRNIEAYLMPIEQIISICDRKIFDLIGLPETYEYSARSSPLDNVEIYIDDKSIESLRYFFSSLGQGYCEESIKLCERVENDLRAHRSELAASCEKSRKVRLTVSLSLSATVILLFI